MSDQLKNHMTNIISSFDLVLVGCGSMGSALLTGWLKTSNQFRSITVVTPSASSLPPTVKQNNKVTWHTPDTEITFDPHTTTVVVLAVKPHMMTDVLSSWIPRLTQKTLITTVAAGLELSFYESIIGSTQPIIRIMPNTPVTIQQGVSLLLANQACTDQHKAYAQTLMTSVGKTLWCHSDDQLDRCTAISGCGPAFLFAFTKALQDAAQALGCPPEQARVLAHTTVEGSARFMNQSSSPALGTLIDNVASPGGMTAQGLDVLSDKQALTNLIINTTKAAYQQAQALKIQPNESDS